LPGGHYWFLVFFNRHTCFVLPFSMRDQVIVDDLKRA
jgi:hypothetical protein